MCAAWFKCETWHWVFSCAWLLFLECKRYMFLQFSEELLYAFPEPKSDFAFRALFQCLKFIIYQLSDRWVLFLKSIRAFLSARVYLMVYVTTIEIHLLHLFFLCCTEGSDFYLKYWSSIGEERESKLICKWNFSQHFWT